MGPHERFRSCRHLPQAPRKQLAPRPPSEDSHVDDDNHVESDEVRAVHESIVSSTLGVARALEEAKEAEKAGLITASDFDHVKGVYLASKSRQIEELVSSSDTLEGALEDLREALHRDLVTERDYDEAKTRYLSNLRRREEAEQTMFESIQRGRRDQDRLLYALRVTLKHGADLLSPTDAAALKAEYLKLAGLDVYIGRGKAETAEK